MKHRGSLLLIIVLIAVALLAGDAWRRTHALSAGELNSTLSDLRDDVRSLREKVDTLERRWLQQQSTLVKLETAVNLQRAGAEWPIDFKAVRDEARKALEMQESLPTPATQALETVKQAGGDELESLMQQLTETAATEPAAADTTAAARATAKPAPKAMPVAELKPSPKGTRTTLVISSTPSGDVARTSTAGTTREEVLPAAMAEVEIDGERVFKAEDLARLATSATQSVEAETPPDEPEPEPATPAPTTTPATAETAAPAPAPAPMTVRTPAPRRPTVEADPALPGATPAATERPRARSTVRVITDSDTRQASEPAPEAIPSEPARATAATARPAQSAPGRVTSAQERMLTPGSMPTPVAPTPTPGATPARPAPQRVTSVPSVQRAPLVDERPIRRSRLGRDEPTETERARFSLNMSEQVVVGPRPQGKVTMADILEAAEQQEGETPAAE